MKRIGALAIFLEEARPLRPALPGHLLARNRREGADSNLFDEPRWQAGIGIALPMREWPRPALILRIKSVDKLTHSCFKACEAPNPQGTNPKSPSLPRAGWQSGWSHVKIVLWVARERIMASFRADKRALARAGKMMSSGNGSRSFTSGLLFGLSSASLIFGGEIKAPKAPKEGLESDWQAVGADISRATGKRGG